MTAIQSEVNRLTAQYDLIMSSDLFNESDREKLGPQLQKRITDARNKLENPLNNYEVQGAIEVTPTGRERKLI